MPNACRPGAVASVEHWRCGFRLPAQRLIRARARPPDDRRERTTGVLCHPERTADNAPRLPKSGHSAFGQLTPSRTFFPMANSGQGEGQWDIHHLIQLVRDRLGTLDGNSEPNGHCSLRRSGPSDSCSIRRKRFATALFDLAIDSKLRGCDLVKVKIGDLVAGGRVRNRAMVIQQKTKRPVQFELLEPARSTILAWLERRGGGLDEFAFPSRVDRSDHMSTRQYARLVDEWVTGIGLRREDSEHIRYVGRRQL